MGNPWFFIIDLQGNQNLRIASANNSRAMNWANEKAKRRHNCKVRRRLRHGNATFAIDTKGNRAFTVSFANFRGSPVASKNWTGFRVRTGRSYHQLNSISQRGPFDRSSEVRTGFSMCILRTYVGRPKSNTRASSREEKATTSPYRWHFFCFPGTKYRKFLWW